MKKSEKAANFGPQVVRVHRKVLHGNRLIGICF